MPFPNPATQLKGSLPGRTLPAIGKRRAHKERREAEKRIAINGPPPLFEGDSIDYYRDVLSGEIPGTSRSARVLRTSC